MIVRKKVRGLARSSLRCALGCSSAIVAGLAGAPASAQQAEKPPPRTIEKADSDIVVTGQRGSAVTDVEPLATFDSATIAGVGATTMEELLRVIKPAAQSADGSDPIFLLNAQRVSGYQEIGTLPPEAIAKVEVLPEAAALKFGYPPTRRILNFITKRQFRQIEQRDTIGTTTRGGSARGDANLALTRLRGDGRLTATLQYRHTEPLFQSERAIAPDPDILFDGLGNVTGLNQGQIDPALSAVAGQVVTVAPVPQASGDRTIAGFANGANQPRLFDLGPYRTMVARNDALKAEAVLANRLGKTLAWSLSLSAEQSRDRTVSGPAPATLIVPGTNPWSPFAGTVLLDRYLTEVDPLRQRQTTTTLHAGGLVRGAIAGWRWDFTAMLDQQTIAGRSERSIDLQAANAAIAAGANPFVPLDPSLLQNRLVDVAQLRTRTAGVKTVITNTPIRVPAGQIAVTATVEFDRSTADSFTRGANPFDLHLGRTRAEGAIAIDIPLTSRREHFLPFIGDLSVNASVNAREISGFGSLVDTTFGVTWGPLAGVQLLAQVKRSAVAPSLSDLSNPVVHLTNVPIFDYGNGRTELVTLIQSGNPDLAAEHRLVRSLGLTIKPFAKRELRANLTYEATTIHDRAGTVYAVTPQIEAILPDLFVRDAGRLVSVAFQPINFYREQQRVLNMTLSANGVLGKPPPTTGPKTGKAGAPPPRPNFYAGMGPGIKFGDRLQLRPGTAELDLLNGDTVGGGGMARAYGYAYGGINYAGNGMSFDGWYAAANRARGATPAADLRFSPIFRLNMSAFINLHYFLKTRQWTRKVQVKVSVSNITDGHQQVRDGNGRVPNRFQPDYLDPVGRTVSLTLRKLF